jgi:SAM-dependent methyltransferase
MDILIAGCGTNQAAVFAYTNPKARVVALDVSDSSLNHHRHLRDKYGLQNLELHRLPIEEVGSLHREFDLIVSTGVLHHMADPDAGLLALAGCLRPEGVVALMMYARYGRIGVEMMQAMFRDLGLQQDEDSLDIVRQAIAALAQDHPLHSYLGIAPDLQYDAGLVDTCLHGRDRSYTVDDCLALVDAAGLVFQEWFMKSPYYPPAKPDNSFEQALVAVTEARQWAIMETINSRNACHFFTACSKDRSTSHYRFDFASPEALDYVPALRLRCAIEGAEIVRPGWRMTLEGTPLVLARFSDGQRSIREIIEMARYLQLLPQGSQAEHQASALQSFRQLWQADFMLMHLQSTD